MRERPRSRRGKNCYRARVAVSDVEAPKQPALRRIAAGGGLTIHEYVCTAGPRDRPFEEQHSRYTIAAVVSGSFVYKTDGGRGLLVPGSLLLGNPGACYECGHDHSTGDRCVSFQFELQLFEELAASAARSSRFRFPAGQVPANDALLPLLTAVETAAETAQPALQLEELAVAVAERVIGELAGARAAAAAVLARDEQRISEVLRYVEQRLDEPLELDELAAVAGLSKYHFLRTFRSVVGRSPYQHLLLQRMHRAALSLVRTEAPVSSIALDAGFGDLSTFHRRFRAIFGASPKAYRQRARALG